MVCKTADWDSAGAPLISYIGNEMKVPLSERILWTDWDGEAVREAIETAKLMTAYHRSKRKPPFSCAVIVDDHAEDQQVVRSKSSNGQGGELVSLFGKGRHFWPVDLRDIAVVQIPCTRNP